MWYNPDHMSCELFGVDLRLMGFSTDEGCCPFANSQSINKSEISESCQALNDIKEEGTPTIEDAEQDLALQTLISLRRKN